MKKLISKLVLWISILIVWIGALSILRYSISQHYAKNVAVRQFDEYTEAYKVLHTTPFVEKLTVVILLFGIVLIFYKMISILRKYEKKEL